MISLLPIHKSMLLESSMAKNNSQEFSSYYVEKITPSSHLPTDTITHHPITFVIRNCDGWNINTKDIWLSVKFKTLKKSGNDWTNVESSDVVSPRVNTFYNLFGKIDVYLNNTLADSDRGEGSTINYLKVGALGSFSDTAMSNDFLWL